MFATRKGILAVQPGRSDADAVGIGILSTYGVGDAPSSAPRPRSVSTIGVAFVRFRPLVGDERCRRHDGDPSRTMPRSQRCVSVESIPTEINTGAAPRPKPRHRYCLPK